METEDWTAIAAGIVRHVLTSLAGVLVTSGWLTNSEVSTFVGGGCAIVAFAWSWWQKIGQKRARAQLQGTIEYLKTKSG